MKVILLQDIPNVGKKHEVKEVSAGLARNFLIPRGKAELATESAVQKIKIMGEKREKEIEKKNTTLQNALATLKDKTITMHAKTNEKGSLFAAITEDDIAKAIREQEKIDFSSSNITLTEPIKKVGKYTAEINDRGKSKEIIQVMIEAL